MRCPFCNFASSSVVDKRAVSTSGEIRRRRECLKCHRRYTTYERLCALEIQVIKRDGSKQLFDRSKLRAGIERSLEKRPSLAFIEQIIDKVEKRIKLRDKKEIETKVIGQAVLAELKKVDTVAYLRFVSVYRHFQEVDDFTKELQHLAAVKI